MNPIKKGVLSMIYRIFSIGYGLFSIYGNFGYSLVSSVTLTGKPRTSFPTSPLSRSHDALSALTASVLGHMKLLFRITRSVGCVSIRSGCPRAVTLSAIPPHSMVMVRTVSGERSVSLNFSDSSGIALSAATAMMQSPRRVRCVSRVTSRVVKCCASTFKWPRALTTSFKTLPLREPGRNHSLHPVS